MIKLPYNQQLAEAGAPINLAATGQQVMELAFLKSPKLTGNTLFFTMYNSPEALQTRPENGVLGHHITGIWLGYSPNLLETKTWFGLDKVKQEVQTYAPAYEGWKFVWIPDTLLDSAKPEQELW